VFIANNCAASDVSSPSAVRTRAATCAPLGSGDDIARNGLNRLRGNCIPAAARVDRARHNHAEPLLRGKLACARFVELLRWSHTEHVHPVAIVRADEAGAFERARQHGLERPVERGIVGAILEVGNDD
jgi:hypothetical protein